MINKKSTAVIIIFIGICLFISIISLSEDAKKLLDNTSEGEIPVEETNFIEVSFYKLQGGEPSIELNSKQLSIKDENLLTFESPQGLLMSKDKNVKYSAEQGEMNQVNNVLSLEGSVSLTEKDSAYSSDNIRYFGKTDQLFAEGNVRTLYRDEKTRDKLELRSDRLESVIGSKIMVLSGMVKGEIERARRYEGKMEFAAKNVEVNGLKSLVKLSNDVELRRNNYYLSAGNAEIFLENYNKKLKYYMLYDDVELEEKLSGSGKDQLRRAFAERMVAHQRSGKIILSGAPRVEQGGDVIKGYQITLRENVELVEVDDSKSRFNLKRKKQ